MPKVSIIVPVYNVEKYLAECVDSILNQTVQDIEVILVDDGSTDHSPVICDQYARADCRVNVIHKPNGGASSARNVGLQNITGQWCMFVDSDDVYDANIVKELLGAATASNVRMAICSLAYWNNDHVRHIDEARLNAETEQTTSHGIINGLWRSEYDNSLFTSPEGKRFRWETMECGKKHVANNLYSYIQ